MGADSSDIALSRNPANGGQNLQWFRGDVVFDDTYEHEVLSRLIERRARWWADERGVIGSQIRSITHVTAATSSQADAYAREALRPMTDAGRITVTKVVVTIPVQAQGSRLIVSVFYIPRSGQQQVARVAV